MPKRRLSSKTIPPITIRAIGDWPPERVTPAGDIILSEHDAEVLRALGRRIQFGAETHIYGEGGVDSHIWLILSGIVRMSHLGEDGTRTVFAFHWPGDIFGLGEKRAYISTAVALTEVAVLRFNRDKLRVALLHAPQLQNDLLLKSTAELRMSQRNRLLLTLHPASRKIAAFLVQLTAHAQCFNETTSVLTLPFSRNDMAAFLDMKIETASRALSALEAAKFVERLSARSLKLHLPSMKRFVGT